MPRLLALTLVLVVAACASPTTHASSKQTASSAPSTSPSVAPITPSPTPSGAAADLPISTVSFSCRLPVMVETSGSDPVSFQGGFITFPAATFTADPGGVINSRPASQDLATAQVPQLVGATNNTGLPFYDAAANRWIPAGATQSAPDGSAYAYGTPGPSPGTGTINIVTVGTGVARTIAVDVPTPNGSNEVLVDDFDGSNVYFTVGQLEGSPSGVWSLSPASGKVVPAIQLANVLAVRNGSAWIGYVDPHDPSPPRIAASGALFDSLVQVNLTTGTRTTWIYRPGQAMFLKAIDASGRPVVAVSQGPDFLVNPPDEIRRLDQPVSGGEDNGELVYAGPIWFEQPQTDGDRIWFGNDRGIYLYTPSTGLQKVFSFSHEHQSLFPAGFCR